MSRLSRFLPKFLRGDKDKLPPSKTHCKIILLDESVYFMPFKRGLKGQFVLDKTFDQLNLFEKDYFGLRYVDHTGQTHWLDGNKTFSSQLKGCAVPYIFYFGVKFYPADPCKLNEEITRYQFFLQLKSDILHGRLPVSFAEAAELFAYAIQSEIGDYESQQLPPGYVSEFQFVPNQTEALEEQIAALHRRLGGTIPATAELKFLDKVKWLEMYGVDLHPVMGEGSTEYFLGLTPTGIVVYKNESKVGNYFWPRITKVNFKGKVFIIKVKDKINDEHTYAFELSTKAACKHLWKCCVEHNEFFRLGQTGSSSSRTSKPFRSTSKHRNSGQQEQQATIDQIPREQPQVLRVQSRRQARRALSDTRLNQGDVMTGIQYTEGHVTMVVSPEDNKGSRHHSLPDLKTRESPTSTRSAPWETNVDIGLYTSGRESPISVTQSDNINYLRRCRESDSESGHRRKKETDSGSESDISQSLAARQKKAKSAGIGQSEEQWQMTVQSVNLPNKENKPTGMTSLQSAPFGEAKQKKMRRRHSKSPGGSNRRPPDELREHIEFNLIEPPADVTEDQLRKIPYVSIETKAEPFKVQFSPSNRKRYRSPKRKPAGDVDVYMKPGLKDPSVVSTKPNHMELSKIVGHYSDIGSVIRRQPLLMQYNTLSPNSKHTESNEESFKDMNYRSIKRDPDTGLNCSRSSNSTGVHMPSHPVVQTFRTHDDIAQLYGSASTTRRPTFVSTNLSNISANQIVSNNKNFVDAKLSSSYGHQISMAESVPKTDMPGYADILDLGHASSNNSRILASQSRGNYVSDQHNNLYSSNSQNEIVNQSISKKSDASKIYHNISTRNIFPLEESSLNQRPVYNNSEYLVQPHQYSNAGMTISNGNALGYFNDSLQMQSYSVHSETHSQSQTGNKPGLQQTFQYVGKAAVKNLLTDLQQDEIKATIKQAANQNAGNAVITSPTKMQGTNRLSVNQITAGTVL